MRRNTSRTSTLNVIRLTGKNPPVRGNTEPGILIHPLSGLVLGQGPKRARKTSRCSARNEVPVKNICVDFQHLTQQCRTYSPAFIELLRIERTGLAVLETDALLQRTHHAPSHSNEVTDNAQKSDHGRDNVSGSNAIGRIIHLARFVILWLDVDEVSTAHAPAMLSIDQTTLNTSAQQSNRTAHRGAHHRDRTGPQRNVSVRDPSITGTEEIVRGNGTRRCNEIKDRGRCSQTVRLRVKAFGQAHTLGSERMHVTPSQPHKGVQVPTRHRNKPRVNTHAMVKSIVADRERTRGTNGVQHAENARKDGGVAEKRMMPFQIRKPAANHRRDTGVRVNIVATLHRRANGEDTFREIIRMHTTKFQRASRGMTSGSGTKEDRDQCIRRCTSKRPLGLTIGSRGFIWHENRRARKRKKRLTNHTDERDRRAHKTDCSNREPITVANTEQGRKATKNKRRKKVPSTNRRLLDGPIFKRSVQ